MFFILALKNSSIVNENERVKARLTLVQFDLISITNVLLDLPFATL
jgi:hypothetical protein